MYFLLMLLCIIHSLLLCSGKSIANPTDNSCTINPLQSSKKLFFSKDSDSTESEVSENCLTSTPVFPDLKVSPLKPLYSGDDEVIYRDLLMKFIKYSTGSRIGRKNHRFASVTIAMALILQRNAKVLVELGTARNGDRSCIYEGCSTVIYGQLAQLIGARLFSIDSSAHACREAQGAVAAFAGSVEVINEDSVTYLRNFDQGQIDFLYVDSLDFDEKNIMLSQKQFLKEIETAYGKLHKESVIVIDDCGLAFGGSCPLAKEYLLSKGWELLHNSFQQIFIYKSV